MPLYIQVKQQICDEIIKGNLKVGIKLPTERELSDRLKVCRNTVNAAYSGLKQDGVLKSNQGMGTFVIKQVAFGENTNVINRIITFVDLGIEKALEMGVKPEEFLEIINQRVYEKNRQ